VTLNIREILRRIADAILDFVYPPLCLSCGQLLASGREQVCRECWSAIKRVERDLPLLEETRLRLLESGMVDELVSMFVFEKEGPFQKIAHALKYSGIEKVGFELGRRLGEEIRRQSLRADVLVPVPLHRRKFRERGYNQSEAISRGISQVLGVPVRVDLIRRSKWTQTQTKLSREERERNVENAFECRSLEVRGLAVMIVDDVITTGATIESCASVLKGAGAAKIIAASAALAQRDTA
jgi:ComF family protein